MHRSILLLALLAAGCAAHDIHGNQYDCQANPADPRCAQRKPKSHKGDVWYCEGPTKSSVRCGWITRDQLDDLLRSIPH